MATSLYQPLQKLLEGLVNSIKADRNSTYKDVNLPPSLPPFPQEQLSSQIITLWEGNGPKEGDGVAGSSSSSSRSVEVIRGLMDVLGRDLVVNPIVREELADPDDDTTREEKCRFQTDLQDRLDVVLTLYEVVYASHPEVPSLEPGAIFIPLLEELVELLSVETWHDLWTYIETRPKRFTKNMPASKGKALPLLRTINAFLRFLPRTPAELVFRGRVHQFASSVISVADKSAINMRGDYSDVKTTWEEEDANADSAGGDAEGAEPLKDEKMEVEGETEAGEQDSIKKEAAAKEKQPDFYSTLWSLQQYFSSPPSLDGPPIRLTPDEPPQTPFQLFKSKSDFVLPILFAQTQKEKEMMGKEVGAERKRKRAPESFDTFFHPRYLTGKRLLEQELADTSFRRQILVQYFILFQFLLNLTPSSASKQAFTGGMPKTFVINADDEVWVKQKVASIREELRKMIPDGARFEETVLSIITRERHYAQWKNDGCPENSFEIPPLAHEDAHKASNQWKRRTHPPPAYPFKLGSRPLSKLWNKGFTNMDQLKGWKRAVDVQQLDEEIAKIDADEEDDRAMGKEPSPETLTANAEKKINLTWRGIRLSTQSDIRHFYCLGYKRYLHVLTQAVKNAENLRNKAGTEPATPSAEAEVGAGDRGGVGEIQSPAVGTGECGVGGEEIEAESRVEEDKVLGHADVIDDDDNEVGRAGAESQDTRHGEQVVVEGGEVEVVVEEEEEEEEDDVEIEDTAVEAVEEDIARTERPIVEEGAGVMETETEAGDVVMGGGETEEVVVESIQLEGPVDSVTVAEAADTLEAEAQESGAD